MAHDFTDLILDGQKVAVPPLYFLEMEEAWEVINEYNSLASPAEKGLAMKETMARHYARVNQCIKVFEIAFRRTQSEWDFKAIKSKLRNEEIFPMLEAMNRLMVNSGLSMGEGKPSIAEVPSEEKAPEQANDSTAISHA